MDMNVQTLLNNTIDFVKKELSQNDASHDYWHIERVWKIATDLAKMEGVQDLEIIQLAALLHDIKDWKYSNSETAGVEAAEQFLKSQNYDETKVKKIVEIIENVSFKNEIDKNSSESISIEAAIVQDADRLDGIKIVSL